MKHYAEYVSKGHPDRLCDRIVESIVDYVVKKDKDALCGLECAVHTNKVFVDGRIAAGKTRKVISHKKIKEIVREVYKNTQHNSSIANENFRWEPLDKDLIIYLDVCIELLSDDERMLRSYSDDQNVVSGYAINNKVTNYLPIAHYLALRLGREFDLRHEMYNLGPDYKILVQLTEENGVYEWDRITVSIQHRQNIKYKDMFNCVKTMIHKGLEGFFNVPNLTHIDDDKILLNGAGDFIQGGPEGDNGLSGKKLCIDFYGPEVPIGRGAICGKDPHKIDVCGAFKARQLAKELVIKHGFYSVFVNLVWSPGEKEPYIIQAFSIDEFGTKMLIDESLLPPKDTFSIDCINNDLKLNEMNRYSKVMSGYMW